MNRPTDQRLSADALERDVISATVAITGYPEAHVRQFVGAAVQYLLREYGGERLPKVSRLRPELAIVNAVVEGRVSKRAACREFGIGKSKLYRLLREAKSA